MKKDNMELVVKQEAISPIVKKAQMVRITSSSTMKFAVELLSEVNRTLDAIEEDKERLTGPLNEALRDIRGRYKPLEEPLKEAIDSLRKKIGDYQTAEVKKARAQGAELAKLVGDGRKNVTPEKVIEKLNQIVTPASKVRSGNGEVRFREDKIIKVVNRKKIPQEYWILDEAAVLKDLKRGYEIPGVVLDTVQVPINSR